MQKLKEKLLSGGEMIKNKSERKNVKREKKFRLRLLFRKKFIFLNTLFQAMTNRKEFFLVTKLSFRVTQNNVFCTLVDLVDGKILEVVSAGKCKVKVSKKTLRYNTKILVSIFLKKIRLRLQKKHITVSLIGSLRVRKPILKQVFDQFGIKTSITASINSKKCFNGCRPKKKRRKKQRSLKIFK
jgi:ribosomal protein S11